MSKVTIVDYGIGNIRNVQRAFEYCGADVTLSSDPQLIQKAERVVVPGVGSFASCMEALTSHHCDEAIQTFITTKRPFLGICVGMQMLLEESLEFNPTKGLGLIPGKVIEIPRSAERKVPFIGWTSIDVKQASPLLKNITAKERFYFVHSFYAQLHRPEHLLASYHYHGLDVTAATSQDHIFGLQFHPEKSGPAGLKVIKNFLTI